MRCKKSMMKIQTLFVFAVVIFTSFGCKEKWDSQTVEMSSSSEEYRAEDYEKVQGVVLKMVPVSENELSSNTKSDIYYVYNIDQTEPKIGVVKNSDSKFGEDDLITVMVNKENSSLSFIDRRGMVDQEVLYKYLKRADSSFYRMKRQVPFE